MRTACFIAILICLSCCKHSHMEMQNGKDFDTKLEELILFEKKINQEYYLKVDVPKEVLEYRLTYMGSVENNEKEKLNFIYFTKYSGLYEDSKRANSVIVIYKNQKRLGHYYVGGGFNKTPIISRNEMIVGYDEDNCNQFTRICFRDSIPQEIFICCRIDKGKQFGDVYHFEKSIK